MRGFILPTLVPLSRFAFAPYHNSAIFVTHVPPAKIEPPVYRCPQNATANRIQCDGKTNRAGMQSELYILLLSG